MIRVVYFGHLDNRSYGDEIGWYLFNSFVDKHYSKHIKLSYLSIYPKKIKQNISDKFIPDYDFYILGCGTCVSNIMYPFADKQLYALHKANKRYGIFGAGVFFEAKGRKKNRKRIFMPRPKETKNFIDSAEYIAVRDPGSKKFLSTLSDRKDINVIYDVGMSIPNTPKKRSGKMKNLGVNITKDAGACIGTISFKDSLLDPFIKFIHRNKSNYSIFSVPFNTRDVNWAQKGFGLKVQNHRWGDVEHIIKLTEAADIFVGVRVHSDITCAALGIPFVSIAYTKPNKLFLEHIKYPYYIDLEKGAFSIKELDRMFNMVRNKYDEIREHLIYHSNEAKKIYNKEAHKLCQIILKS